MNPRISRQFQKYRKNRIEFLFVLDQFSDQQLSFKKDSETWSILEIFEHIVLAEEVSRLGILKGMEKRAVLKNSGIYTGFKSFLLNLTLWANIKVKAPTSRIKPLSQSTFSELKERVQISDSSWEQLLESFPNELLIKTVFKHPIAGLITLLHTLQFMAEHINHHIHQISNIKKLNGFPK